MQKIHTKRSGDEFGLPHHVKQIEAMSFALSRSLVGLMWPKMVERTPEVGSGVTLRHRGLYFVATAKHNLSRLFDKLSTEQIKMVAGQQRLGAAAPKVQQVIYAKDGNRDCAALLLDSKYAESWGCDWIDVAEQASTKRQFASVVASGYPAERVTMHAEGLLSFGLSELTYECVPILDRSLPMDEQPQTLDPAADIFLPWDSRKVREHNTGGRGLPMPDGMSGCGVFGLPRAGRSGIWDPHSAPLLGIVRSFLPESKLLRVAGIATWFRIIDAWCDDNGISEC